MRVMQERRWRRFRILAVPVAAAAVLLGLATPTRAEPATTVNYTADASATRYSGLAFDTCTNDAVANAKALGMTGGSALYNDIEPYAATDANCRAAVLRYLSAWTKQAHRLGYVAGVYAQLSSGAANLAQSYASAGYARPDALWIARYDGVSSLTGWAGVPDRYWAVHQRAKQYRNSHNETYGGVTINIDNDRVDAPVATVGYRYRVTSSAPLNARSGPAASYPVTGTRQPGSTLTVICQAPGSAVGTTSVWDKLTDGSYVTDYYVSTPSSKGYSAPMPRCSYPYQVAANGGVNERTGPGASYPVTGTLPGGSLAWLACQKAGTTVGSTRIWDKLTDGRWVTDYYVATPSNTTYSKPAPRC